MVHQIIIIIIRLILNYISRLLNHLIFLQFIRELNTDELRLCG